MVKKIFGMRSLKSAAYSVALCAFPGVAIAQSAVPAPNGYIPNLEDVMKASDIFLAGYATAGYTADLNGGNTLNDHVFDSHGNTFELNQVGLLAARVPQQGIGFKTLVIGGTDAKVLNSFYGSGDSDFALFIAYGSYTQGPFSVIAGRFPALSGYELAPAVLDTQISRSLVLALAQPVPLTGVRVNYTISPELTATVSLSNSDSFGTAAAIDDVGGKTVEFGAAFTPTSAIKIAAYDYYGTQSDANGGKNDYLDLVASYQVTQALSLAVNGDYKKVFDTTAIGGKSTTLGAAGYINYAFSPHYAASIRAEDVNISDDQTGTCENNIKEATLTGIYTYNQNLKLKAEGRYSLASSNVDADAEDFDDGTLPGGSEKFSHGQGELEVSAVFSFGGL